jgi:hypothetical protein
MQEDAMSSGHRKVKLLVRAASAFLLVFALADGVAAQAVSFVARRDFAILTNRGGSVATGDFNRDGIQDLVTSGGSLFLGNGDATFQPAKNFIDFATAGVAVGDFNRDGIQDLVMMGLFSAPILIGVGDGTFQHTVTIPGATAREEWQSIAIGDFNRDGAQDLVIGSRPRSPAPFSSYIVLGNGDGTFQSLSRLPTGAANVAIGEFNGDGIQDLALAGGVQDVAILIGVGDGSFQLAQSVGAGMGGLVAVSDFNGDGMQDLAVTHSNDVSTLLGNGDGTFQPARAFATGESPNSIAIGDFNGDGVPDLAVTNMESNDLSVLIGIGDGSFRPSNNLLALNLGSSSSVVAIDDFNRDGIQDLAVRVDQVEAFGSVSIFVGNGDGSFRSGLNSAGGGDGSGFAAVGDFNGDGIPDLAVGAVSVTPGTPGSVSILIGKGDGHFQSPLSYPSTNGHPSAIAVGDFNGDGFQDLVVANGAFDIPFDNPRSIVSLFFGNGDGTFQQLSNLGLIDRAVSVAIGDFDRDGIQDLAVVREGPMNSGRVSIFTGNGIGQFRILPELVLGQVDSSSSNSIAIGDFNGDNIQDLAVSIRFSNTVSVFRGNGDGSFQPARDFALAREPTSVAVGDFNSDGIQDLALSNRDRGDTDRVPVASILIGNGDGTFQPVQEFGPENRAGVIVVSDFNGDGKQDLATRNPLSNNVTVLLGNGDGAFQAAGDFGPGGGFLTIGDFDKDGAPDLAVSAAGSVSILLNDTESQERKVVNGLVNFQPRSTTFHTTIDPAACPGFVAVFRFDATLTNKSSSPSLADLIVQVATLTNGNLLQNAEGGPSGVGAILTVPHKDGFLDGILSPQESVAMPFVICLKNTQPFTFFVNVLGTEASNINNSLAWRRLLQKVR